MDYSDAKIDHTRMSKGSINGKKAGTNRELDKADGYLKDVTNGSGMEYFYYTVQYHLAF